MAIVTVSAPAQSDLEGVLEHLRNEAGNPVAQDYLARFSGLFAALAVTPEIGAPRPKLGIRTRLHIVDPYNVYYEFDGGNAIVLRVLHGRRRITRAMMKPHS